MLPIPPRSGHRRRSGSDDLLTLGEVAFRFGAEACGQWWAIVGRSWGREVNGLVEGAMASVPPVALLRGLAGGYLNCLSELATISLSTPLATWNLIDMPYGLATVAASCRSGRPLASEKRTETGSFAPANSGDLLNAAASGVGVKVPSTTIPFA